MSYSAPETWAKVSLGELTSGTRPICYGVLKPGEYTDGGVPLVRITDISGNYFDGSDLYLISEDLDREFSRSKLVGGEILISIQGTIGRVAICPEKYRGANVSRTIAIIEPDDRVCKKYLYWFLRYYGERELFDAFGATRASLNIGTLRDLEIPLPPLPEQKRIAAILDKADAIRRKRQQAIQLADDFLRAVFLDMFGDPVTNPKGWPKRTLKLLGKSATGRTPPSEKADMWGEGLPFVTPGDLSGRVDSSVREVTQEGAEHSKVCRTGSLLVCCIGATIGKVGIAGCPVAFNQQINAQEWGADILDVYGYFVFKLFPDLVRERAIQTTLPILKKSLFDEIEIPVPAKGIQEGFAVLAQKISSFSARHESGVEMPIFESLSQLAFSGQL